MPMSHNGLTKLIEECGEVIQAAAKLQEYPSGIHPDGGPELHLRLQDELADLRAAARFVVRHHKLDEDAMSVRACAKFALYTQWCKEEPTC